MKEKKDMINSYSYWNERFSSGDWDNNGGCRQTRYFYSLLTKLLPDWFKDRIRKDVNLNIVDFGCAEGDGVPILSAELNNLVCGVDFSEVAIQKAQERFKGFNFKVGDICNYGELVDISILSNVIEHFPNPYEVLKTIANKTSKYVIVMVPLEERNLMAEHCYTFKYRNIPIVVGDFKLIFFTEHDCRKDSEQLFFAKQVLLIYAKEAIDIETIKISQLDGLLFLRDKQEQEAKSLQTVQADIYNLRDSLSSQTQKCESLISKYERKLDDISTLLHKFIEKHSESLNELQLGINTQAKIVSKATEQALQIPELKHENHVLSQQNEELTNKYYDLVNRFNQLNEHYGYVISENVRIIQSRTYKAAELEKKLLRKLHLLGSLKFALSVRRNGWKEALRQYKVEEKRVKVVPPLNTNITQPPSNFEDNSSSADEQWRCSHRLLCETLLNEHLSGNRSEITEEISKIIETQAYEGIVVYPHAVHWEPVQRPQHFLRSFAKQGYLCFFCESPHQGKAIEKVEENLFVIFGEEHLLPALINKCPILLITYHNQSVFCDLLPTKFIWFDALDNFDFFAGGNTAEAASIYKRLLEKANLVTYSADNLYEYVKGRTDAVKLNNAVNPQDFELLGENVAIEKLETIKKHGNTIIGYYGAIEEWFDKEAIRNILDKTSFEVVLIGNCGIDLSDIKSKRLHIIGAVPYRELKNYAKYFDIAIIPFKVNKLTNSVSPVKFFEYAAQGKPVVSSAIHEMKAYTCEMVHIYHDYEELILQLDQLAKANVNIELLKRIGYENSWDQRIDVVKQKITDTLLGLCVFSNCRNTKMVAVESVTFFKYDGSNYYSGGAERYLLDLAEVCKELNIAYKIYQWGEYDWIRFYGQTEVVGMKATENSVFEYGIPLIEEMSATFIRKIFSQSAVTIFSPFYIVGKGSEIPSIGISHGISWDNEYNHFSDGNSFWQTNKNIIDAATTCDRMISVDTNTCNWFQTLNYSTGRKIRYIPNYVDDSIFYPRKNYYTVGEKIIILYPRRLYAPRGLYVVLDIIDEVLTKYPNVEFHFVGKGFEQDTKHVEKKMTQWGNRIKLYSMPPNQMCEVYRRADISLIPTMYSEGTSLSCLEAMASGNAVICTRIGGLTNLVLDGYNGLMIEPNGDALKEALFYCLDSPKEMAKLKENAVTTAKAFSKDKWKKRWKEAIVSLLGEKAEIPLKEIKRCRIDFSSVSNMECKDSIKAASHYLINGFYVFLSCPNNPYKANSCQRLQFIDSNEDLYFVPEVHLTENDLTKGEPRND